LLAGCGVKSEQAPRDEDGYVAVFNRLDPADRGAFSTWWNIRSYKAKDGPATAAHFDLTVGQALELAKAEDVEWQAKVEAQEACADQALAEARNSSATWMPSPC
jgi:hypothetical protein